MLYFPGERHVLFCGKDGIDRIEKREDLFIPGVKVRTYSNDILFAALALPEIYFEHPFFKRLFDLKSMGAVDRNRTAPVGVFFGREDTESPFFGV